MYVWNEVAKKYFGLDVFPIFDMNKANEIWNAHEKCDMPAHEKIVLLSTMDKATVDKKGFPDVIAAFKKYGAEHPGSSITEQAVLLESVALDDGDVIAWNQTSMAEFWGDIYPETDDDEMSLYNPTVSDEHFDIMGDM